MTRSDAWPEPGETLAVLSEHIAGALQMPLPEEVVEKARLHILDTVSACVSGTRLRAGEVAAAWATQAHTVAGVTLIGDGRRAPLERAVAANAMAAHADETDDSHEDSVTHPGASIVPTALAMADDAGSSGSDLLSAVVLGYDIGCRINPALWPGYAHLRQQLRSLHAVGGLFGSVAAASSLARFDALKVSHTLSYAAQRVSGIKTWLRDVDHIEKAFVFAGMPAMDAVTLVSMVDAGFTGVPDVLDGEPNLFSAVGTRSDPSHLVSGLGSQFEILNANIKKYAAGSPAQAPVEALLRAVIDNELSINDVRDVHVRLPEFLGRIVQDRDMANINLRYLLCAALEDRALGFAAAHDQERFDRWRREGYPVHLRVTLDSEMEMARHAIVEVTTTDGVVHSHHERAVRGTKDNPMTRGEVEEKSLDLLEPVLGRTRSRRLIDVIGHIDEVGDCRELREVWTP